jgi:hypothetical protein
MKCDLFLILNFTNLSVTLKHLCITKYNNIYYAESMLTVHKMSKSC